jgi:hypothetical protein
MHTENTHPCNDIHAFQNIKEEALATCKYPCRQLRADNRPGPITKANPATCLIPDDTTVGDTHPSTASDDLICFRFVFILVSDCVSCLAATRWMLSSLHTPMNSSNSPYS